MTALGQTVGNDGTMTLTIPQGGNVTVFLDGSGSSGGNGSITTYEWRSNGAVISTASNFSFLAGTSNTIALKVTNTLGSSSTAQAQISIVFSTTSQAPQITSIAPPIPFSSGLEQVLTVNGSGFQSGLSLTLTFPGGGSTTLGGAAILSVTSASLQVVTTFNATGAWGVRVNNPDAIMSNTFSFAVAPQSASPQILSTSPANLTISSFLKIVTVTGSGFQPGLTASITAPGGAIASLGSSQIASLTANSFLALVVLNTAGQWSIQATNPDGKTSNSFAFSVQSAASQIRLTPATLDFQVSAGGSPPKQTILVDNVGGGTLAWNAQATTVSGGGWITLAPAVGSAPGTVSVSINAAGLSVGTYQGTISILASSASNSPQTVPVTLTVLPVATISLAVQPTDLAFTAADNTAPNPATIVIDNTGGVSLNWSVTSSTTSGGTWLSVATPSGRTPGVASVSANAAGLAPGVYQGSVLVQTTGTPVLSQLVPVVLTVSVSPPRLSVSPTLLNFDAREGAVSPMTQTLRIGNLGGSAVDWQASISAPVPSWLRISPASGTAAGSPSVVQVTTNPNGLAAGVYTATVGVTPSGGQAASNVAVTLRVSKAPQSILVSQTGLHFTGVQAGSIVPSQTFGVINTREGSMSWIAKATTVAGGNWLSVSPSSGASTANSLDIPLVTVQVDASGLTSGDYSGAVQVIAPGADNTPQIVIVNLTVLPQGSEPPVLVRPTGLIFAAATGSTAQISRAVTLSTATPRTIQATGFVGTIDGAPWLEAAPRKTSFSPGSPQNVMVLATPGSLAPGYYRGLVSLGFTDNSQPQGNSQPSQVVDVLLVVTPGSGSVTPQSVTPQAVRKTPQDTNPGCVPQQLSIVGRTLGSNFTIPVGWPVTIEVEVRDNCGNPIPNATTGQATVIARFDNGDPALALVYVGSQNNGGVYHAMWLTTRPPSPVNITINALSGSLAEATLTFSGATQGNPAAFNINPGGVVNAASSMPNLPLAPGSIVSVYGNNMSGAATSSSSLPLPKELAGASLSVGGFDAPLFYSSPTQINAQIPFELPPNIVTQAVVKSRTPNGSIVLSVPEMLVLSSISPGIFTLNSQGSGQGVVLDTQGNFVDAAHSVGVGDYVSIYATGLGMTNPITASGQAAASKEPLSRAVNQATARVGGISAPVTYAGLAGGYVGLYQVNIQIPPGVQPSASVELVLSQNGKDSNKVTLSIH